MSSVVSPFRCLVSLLWLRPPVWPTPCGVCGASACFCGVWSFLTCCLLRGPDRGVHVAAHCFAATAVYLCGGAGVSVPQVLMPAGGWTLLLCVCFLPNSFTVSGVLSLYTVEHNEVSGCVFLVTPLFSSWRVSGVGADTRCRWMHSAVRVRGTTRSAVVVDFALHWSHTTAPLPSYLTHHAAFVVTLLFAWCGVSGAAADPPRRRAHPAQRIWGITQSTVLRDPALSCGTTKRIRCGVTKHQTASRRCLGNVRVPHVSAHAPPRGALPALRAWTTTYSAVTGNPVLPSGVLMYTPSGSHVPLQACIQSRSFHSQVGSARLSQQHTMCGNRPTSPQSLSPSPPKSSQPPTPRPTRCRAVLRKKRDRRVVSREYGQHRNDRAVGGTCAPHVARPPVSDTSHTTD